MKLTHPDLSIVFDTEIDQVNTLVIEEPLFLRSFLLDINRQIDGSSGQVVLSENEKPLEMCRKAELLDDFIRFDINRRNLLSRISTAVERSAGSPDHYEKTSQLLAEIERYMYEISFDFPCDILFSKLSVSSLVKSAGILLRDEYDGLAEKVIDYFELVREFDADKLFVTYNMRAVISDEETSEFMDTVLSHGFHVLMVENHEYSRLVQERRWIVDNDLCEIG